MLEVGPFWVLAEGDFFLDHVQRDGCFDDAEVVAVQLFAREVEEVMGYKLTSGGYVSNDSRNHGDCRKSRKIRIRVSVKYPNRVAQELV